MCVLGYLPVMKKVHDYWLCEGVVIYVNDQCWNACSELMIGAML